MTQPGGAGTIIYVFDDASSASGSGYTFAEISAAFPTDFVDNGTNRKSYRAKVDLQIGDTTTNAATTTIRDTDAIVVWDSGKTLKARTTQTTSWFLRLGTKIGSGDTASGVNGCDLTFGAAQSNAFKNAFLYGCIFRQTSGAFTQVPASDGSGEIVNCLYQSSSTGTAPFSFGVLGNSFGNIYNLDISHTTAAQVMSNFNAGTASRVTIAAAAPSSFISSAGGSLVIKDLVMIGSPSVSDIRWLSSLASSWKLISPTWSGNAEKFSGTGPTQPNATAEYRVCNLKVVDRTGAGVASIPVTLTDADGNEAINGTTASDGNVSFGSGITANSVVVMDHYASGSTYVQHHRSPFTMKVNTTDLTGYNSNYLSRTYKFNWPGYDSITTSAGQFEDLGDVIAIQDQTGNPTTWTESTL